MGVRRAAPPAPLREGPHVRAVMWASHLMGKMRGVPCYHGDDWRAPALRLPLDPADATESTDSPCRTTGGGPEDGASAFRRFLALTCAHSAAHASPHTVGCEGCAAAAARDPTHALACRTRPQLPHALRLDPCGGTGCDFGPTAQPWGGQGCAMRARGKSSLCVSAEAGMYRCVYECREALKRTRTSQLMYLKDAVPPGCLRGRWGKRKAVDIKTQGFVDFFGIWAWIRTLGAVVVSVLVGVIARAPSHPTRARQGTPWGASLQLLLLLYTLKHRSQ